MKVTLWHSTKPRERMISEAIAEGIRTRSDDQVELRELKPEVEVADCDVACIFGVKGRELFRAHWAAGIHTLHVDKGYVRRSAGGAVKEPEFWRVSIDGHHPTAYLAQMNCPDDRWARLGMHPASWREPTKTGHVVYAGSSAKYHSFAGLPDPTEYAERLVWQLGKMTDRKIIYRPKPSADLPPVRGAGFSQFPERITDVLKGAHVMITDGSNSCFEAVMAGAPCIILGEAVAKPISSTSLDDLENPKIAEKRERHQWLFDLAYCQWTKEEMASGEMWNYVRRQIAGGVLRSPAWSASV